MIIVFAFALLVLTIGMVVLFAMFGELSSRGIPDMEMPTDRGYAVISSNQDGTVTVQIATAIEKGQPKGVYAK